MRDILITGGAGNIGFDLVSKLVDTNYSVTVLDLESKLSIKKFTKIKDKIKIVYGDIEDKDLVEMLVKKNDIVIDYAGIMPPLADLDDRIANSTNFGGTKNIVDAIKEHNPECSLIYMSFISVYGESDKKRKLKVECALNETNDLYSKSILKSENYIKDNIKNYTILRMPIVLTNNNYYIKHLAKDRVVDFIAMNDLNNIVVSLFFNKNAYGKIFNISGFKMNTTDFIREYYKLTGQIAMISRTIYYGEFADADEIYEITKVPITNNDEVFKQLKKQTNIFIRLLRKMVNFPKYLMVKKGKHNKD